MFMDFVNKIKSTDAMSLKLPYVCSQLNMNKRGKFQKNHLINVVAMTIFLCMSALPGAQQDVKVI